MYQRSTYRQTMKTEKEESKDENTNNETSIIHEIPHYQQRYNWDCGVTCVMMLIDKEQQREMQENFHQICEEEGFGHSTWTIDLCYLLKRFGVPHSMYTTMMGVNEQYRKQHYYDKIIHLDRERVQQRFSLAPSVGISVAGAAFDAAALWRHLARAPALLLVDAGLLACDLCKHNKTKFEFRRCFGGSYRGHYVVAVGRGGGHGGGRVLFRDPAVSARLCAAPLARIARAHRAVGTDNDVILIHRRYTTSDDR